MRALVFAIDDQFIMPFKVLWHSLIKTQSIPVETPVFLLHEETLSLSSINELTRFVEHYSWQVKFINATIAMPDDLPFYETDHVSRATFYRLFMASLLPDMIDSAVYLDCDTLALRTIRALFTLELERPLAAVDHFSHANAVRLWGPSGGTYFQAGVLVIDLSAWRISDIEERFKTVMQSERKQIRWWDQDVLNLVFRDNWQRLPIWFNVSAAAMSLLNKCESDSYARLVHFDGGKKPWTGDQDRAFASWWFDFYEDTMGGAYNLGQNRARVWQKINQFLKTRWRCLIMGA